MKKLKVGNTFALVSDEDYKFLRKFIWHENNGYARTVIYLHNLVLKPKKGKLVDHKNQNRLDNRRENLRYATRSQSQVNRTLIQPNNTSGFRGVYWYKKEKRWRVNVKIKGKKQLIGVYDNPIDAAKAYNKASVELNGEFAVLNEV